MGSWTVSYDTTTITVPRKPERVEVRKSADITAMTLPGDDPIIMSLGVQARSLVVQGTLYETEISVLTSLFAAVYKTVTVSGLGSAYDGSYILQEVSWSHQVPNIYAYTLHFEKGSEMISL
jgi:hypothetical protein